MPNDEKEKIKTYKTAIIDLDDLPEFELPEETDQPNETIAPTDVSPDPYAGLAPEDRPPEWLIRREQRERNGNSHVEPSAEGGEAGDTPADDVLPTIPIRVEKAGEPRIEAVAEGKYPDFEDIDKYNASFENPNFGGDLASRRNDELAPKELSDLREKIVSAFKAMHPDFQEDAYAVIGRVKDLELKEELEHIHKDLYGHSKYMKEIIDKKFMKKPDVPDTQTSPLPSEEPLQVIRDSKPYTDGKPFEPESDGSHRNGMTDLTEKLEPEMQTSVPETPAPAPSPVSDLEANKLAEIPDLPEDAGTTIPAPEVTLNESNLEIPELPKSLREEVKIPASEVSPSVPKDGSTEDELTQAVMPQEKATQKPEPAKALSDATVASAPKEKKNWGDRLKSLIGLGPKATAVEVGKIADERFQPPEETESKE